MSQSEARASEPKSETLGGPRAAEKSRSGALRSLVEWVVVIALGLGAVVGVKYWMSSSLLPDDGTPAPPIRFVDLEDRTLSLADFRGKSVLLHFWAPWCSVCKMETSALNDLQADLPDDAVIVAVALRTTVEDVRAFMAAEGIQYPVYLAGDDIGYRMKIQQFPTTYSIDPEGRIRGRDTGWSPGFRLSWLLDAARE